MIAVKEILLQTLIACSPAFLFPLFYEKTTRLPKRESSDPVDSGVRNSVLLVSCLISMIICTIFASTLFDSIPLNFFLPSLIIGMLYGRLRDGFLLCVAEVCLYTLMGKYHNLAGFVMETGLVIFPLVLLSSTHFKRSGRQGRMMFIMFFLLIGQYFALSLYFLTPRITLKSDLTIIIYSVIYVGVSIFIGLVLMMVIENTLDREKLQQQVLSLSHKTFREAENLQQTMDAAPLAILLLDQDGALVTINDNFLEFCRLENPALNREDLLGLKLHQLADEIGTEYLSTREQGTFVTEELVTELIQVKNRMYLISISPLRKGHTREFNGSVVILQDITEIEHLKDELNKADRLSLVGQMAAGITHEIRNPMAVVRGFLQLMKEKSPSNLDNYYRIVMEELDRANGIINDFLSLAQSRSVNKEESQLDDIIQELSPLLWADANLRGQSIEMKFTEHLPSLHLNTKEMKQLILNLCRNGMEAMEEKGQLTIETREHLEGIELRITDTGPGIPASKRDKLFQPFFTTKTQGTGLGLALCLSIMERHNGKILVESEEGQGTTFIVLFHRPSSRNISVS